jgi:hypothetical protein
MKLKALTLALFVAGAAASLALADDGRKPRPAADTVTTVATTTGETTTTSGKHEEHHRGDCTRLLVGGTVTSLSETSLTVDVTKASDKSLVGKPATFTVGPKTRVSWSGRGTLAGPAQGDTAGVFQVTCGTADPVVAMVAFRPARAEHPAEAKKHD